MNHWEVEEDESFINELGLESVCNVSVVDLELFAQELIDFLPAAMAVFITDSLLYEFQRGLEQSLLICLHDYLMLPVRNELKEVGEVHFSPFKH